MLVKDIDYITPHVINHHMKINELKILVKHLQQLLNEVQTAAEVIAVSRTLEIAQERLLTEILKQ